ncbi:MAG: aminoglycoside phosphotransferase family protein, partial [Candidatus Berkiella sp.]
MQNSGLDLRQWIAQQLNSQAFEFNPLPGDASFRTYYRVLHQDKSYIVMVAPPLKERTQEFVHIASAWHKEGILVPKVLAWQEENGFVLLSDFGDVLLLSRLNAHNVNGFYQDALSQIVLLQNTNSNLANLPPYDLNYANKEIMLFQEWFITKLLNLENTSQESGMWQLLCKNVLENFCHQPQVTVHRDFHSRNLMVLSDDALGIIDFQDAMVGPITYDAVSLLKD